MQGGAVTLVRGGDQHRAAGSARPDARLHLRGADAGRHGARRRDRADGRARAVPEHALPASASSARCSRRWRWSACAAPTRASWCRRSGRGGRACSGRRVTPAGWPSRSGSSGPTRRRWRSRSARSPTPIRACAGSRRTCSATSMLRPRRGPLLAAPPRRRRRRARRRAIRSLARRGRAPLADILRLVRSIPTPRSGSRRSRRSRPLGDRRKSPSQPYGRSMHDPDPFVRVSAAAPSSRSTADPDARRATLVELARRRRRRCEPPPSVRCAAHGPASVRRRAGGAATIPPRAVRAEAARSRWPRSTRTGRSTPLVTAMADDHALVREAARRGLAAIGRAAPSIRSSRRSASPEPARRRADRTRAAPARRAARRGASVRRWRSVADAVERHRLGYGDRRRRRRTPPAARRIRSCPVRTRRGSRASRGGAARRRRRDDAWRSRTCR